MSEISIPRAPHIGHYGNIYKDNIGHFQKKKFDSEQKIKMLFNEIKMNRQAAINGGKKIAKIFDVFENDDYVILVFELLSVNIQNYAYGNSVNISELQIKSFLIQILDCVKFLQEKLGAFHRD